MFIGILLLAFILGSIPTSYFIYWRKTGLDIRDCGSGNMGASNLGRLLSWKYFLFAFVFDTGKGVLAVLFCYWAFSNSLFWATVGGILAILGHIFPAFWFILFKVKNMWRGGKAVATALGVVGAYYILGFVFLEQIGMILGTYLFILLVFDYSSLGSLLASVVALVTQVAYHGIFTEIIWPINVFVLLVVIVLIITHIENIKRLFKREEPRVGVRSKVIKFIKTFFLATI